MLPKNYVFDLTTFLIHNYEMATEDMKILFSIINIAKQFIKKNNVCSKIIIFLIKF